MNNTELAKRFSDEIRTVSDNDNMSMMVKPTYFDISMNLFSNPVWTFRMLEMFVNDMMDISIMKVCCSSISKEVDRVHQVFKYLKSYNPICQNGKVDSENVDVYRNAIEFALNSNIYFMGTTDKLVAVTEENLKLKNPVGEDTEIEPVSELSVGEQIVARYMKNKVVEKKQDHIHKPDWCKLNHFLTYVDCTEMLSSADIFNVHWFEKILSNFAANVLNVSEDFPSRRKLFDDMFCTGFDLKDDENASEQEKKEYLEKYANYVRWYFVTSSLAMNNDVLSVIYKKVNTK